METPTADGNGIYQKTFDYDDQDRVIQEQYYNMRGELSPNKDGYVRKTLIYNEDGKVAEERYE